MSRQIEKAKQVREARDQHQQLKKTLAENQAIRDVAMAVNGNNQMLVATLREFLMGRMEIQKIQTPESVLAVVYCEPGQELRDEVCDQMIKLLKMPIVVLPKTMRIEGVKPETLEQFGWTRMGPRSLTDAQGKPL